MWLFFLFIPGAAVVWQTESKKEASRDNTEALRKFEETVKYGNSRYEVRQQLKGHPTLDNGYNDVMQEYLAESS